MLKLHLFAFGNAVIQKVHGGLVHTRIKTLSSSPNCYGPPTFPFNQ